MPTPPCIHFQALPDLSIIRFTTGIAGSILIEIRFTGLHPGTVDMSIEEHHVFHPLPSLIFQSDVDSLLMAILQAIELYTGKYPDRTIRLKGNTKVKGALFRIIMRVHFDLLHPLFSMDLETGQPFDPHHWKKAHSIFLKRKPELLRKDPPIIVTLNTYSRVFGNAIHVRVNEKLPRPEHSQPMASVS
jgi:hypothetical protein